MLQDYLGTSDEDVDLENEDNGLPHGRGRGRSESFVNELEDAEIRQRENVLMQRIQGVEPPGAQSSSSSSSSSGVGPNANSVKRKGKTGHSSKTGFGLSSYDSMENLEPMMKTQLSQKTLDIVTNLEHTKFNNPKLHALNIELFPQPVVGVSAEEAEEENALEAEVMTTATQKGGTVGGKRGSLTKKDGTTTKEVRLSITNSFIKKKDSSRTPPRNSNKSKETPPPPPLDLSSPSSTISSSSTGSSISSSSSTTAENDHAHESNDKSAKPETDPTTPNSTTSNNENRNTTPTNSINSNASATSPAGDNGKKKMSSAASVGSTTTTITTAVTGTTTTTTLSSAVPSTPTKERTRLGKAALKSVKNLYKRKMGSGNEHKMDNDNATTPDRENNNNIATAGPTSTADGGGTAHEDYDFHVKVLLLGDSGVGKTSLMLRFADNQFQQNLMSTAGVDFKVRYLEHPEKTNGKRIKCQIWDTAGQERFHVITRTYYRGSHGIALVYDVTNEQSFNQIQYWMNNIRSHAGENVFVVLFGNKVDLPQRQITYEQGLAAAKKYNALFYETSAKDGTNVLEAFEALSINAVSRIQANQPNSLQANPNKRAGINMDRNRKPCAIL